MTGIRNPKAHDKQAITREDALRNPHKSAIRLIKQNYDIHIT